MKCFISHIHEEHPVAAALKAIIERRVPGCTVWVSGVDLKHGDQWLSELDSAMDSTDKVLVLCSRQSIDRPWVHFEAGFGQGRNALVAPICHMGLTVSDLPIQFGVLSVEKLNNADDLRSLLLSLGGNTDELESDWRETAEAQDKVDYVPGAIKPLRAAKSTKSILVDGAHGQRRWPRRRRGTVFERAESSFSALIDEAEVDVGFLDSADQIRASDMNSWRGLILALPLHCRMEIAKIEQIVEWVHGGGRLLILGFELGDLHHEGNLNDLAARFALRFNGDMVAPKAWEAGKPYDKDIPLQPEQQSGLFDGVGRVVWRNLQTIAIEPGTEPQLTVGSGSLVVPTPDSVGFSDNGNLIMPNPEFTIEKDASWLPVLAKATPELTGNGDVVACGTWDLLPDTNEPNDNVRFVSNLLGWLVER